MMRPCWFVVSILILKTMIGTEVVADSQAWTHKDIAFNGATIKDVQNRNVISPRMDFDEWTPLGRGDPLKNDPTFDYLPPVLDKVHYWKPPPSPSAAVRTSHPSSSTTASVVSPHNYNRRFFLTDFSSKKEPSAAAYVQHVQQQQRKRPVAQSAGHLHLVQHYPAIPKVPLPMLTPPPLYQRPASQAFITTAVTTTVTAASDVMSSSDAGDSGAESKQPPAVRAPPPAQLLRMQQAQTAARPASHSAIIKVLLENEVDRTTVTTAANTVPAAASTRAPPTTVDPLFAHHKLPSARATGRPMYLIIQGHSKVKTYGLVSKSDDLTSKDVQPAHEHNHIGSGPPPDEPSRRKRNDGPATMDRFRRAL